MLPIETVLRIHAGHVATSRAHPSSVVVFVVIYTTPSSALSWARLGSWSGLCWRANRSQQCTTSTHHTRVALCSLWSLTLTRCHAA